MEHSNKNKGFTIVELLIVIVVIGILAAITITAYNGVTKKASASAVKLELSQNAKSIMATASTSGQYSNVDIMTPGTILLKFDSSKYKVISYCSTASSFALVGQTPAGDKFYTSSGSPLVQDNTIDSYQPCVAAGISGGVTTYLNLPVACSTENTTCTFSGTATVVYGSSALGMFTRVLNATSPFNCSNASIGVDPAFSYAKSCYVYPN